MRAVVSALCVVTVLAGCASAAASGAAHPAVKPRAAKDAAEPKAALAPAVAQAAPEPVEPAVLPDTVEGGDIPRGPLLLVLQQGVGRFLQKVRTEPHFKSGRFVGWRIVELFDGSPEMGRGVLLPGDTLVRVNGQSIERPEQFKSVWDTLATESQLVLQVVRAGKQSEIRHRIVQ